MGISIEKFAEVIADAFGPIFAAAATTPSKPFRKPVPYKEMNASAQAMFRSIAEQVMARQGEWNTPSIIDARGKPWTPTKSKDH